MTEQPTDHELPVLRQPEMDEIHHMASSAIMDGIVTGRITNPEALRAYFVRRRVEFLDEHADRAGEVSGSGELARWHGLVYSESNTEYQALATFCDDEAARRRVEESPEQRNDPAHVAGLANLRHMSEAWRARVDRQPDAVATPTPDKAAPGPQQAPAIPRLIVDAAPLDAVPRLVIGERQPLPPPTPGVPRLIINGRGGSGETPVPRLMIGERQPLAAEAPGIPRLVVHGRIRHGAAPRARQRHVR